MTRNFAPLPSLCIDGNLVAKNRNRVNALIHGFAEVPNLAAQLPSLYDEEVRKCLLKSISSKPSNPLREFYIPVNDIFTAIKAPGLDNMVSQMLKHASRKVIL